MEGGGNTAVCQALSHTPHSFFPSFEGGAITVTIFQGKNRDSERESDLGSRPIGRKGRWCESQLLPGKLSLAARGLTAV